MEENQSYLEVLLQKEHHDNFVAKVISAEAITATKKGDNYMSEIKRIKMDVLLKSGKKCRKSIIVKNPPQTEFHKKMTKDMAIFERETTVYRDVLPKFEDILLEFNDYTEPMWPKMIDFKPNEQIIFTDLAESGYIMGKRLEGLDLEHSMLVIRSLAKFHASSVIFIDRGLLSLEMFDKHIFLSKNMKQNMSDYYMGALNRLIDMIETTWEPEWKVVSENLRKNILPNLEELAFRPLQYNENNRFNVLNHGDCWVNNMMFKYGVDSITPISVKFVDYQLCFRQSPVYDLQYILSTSLNINVRKTSVGRLLKVYHETLVKQLNQYSYNGYIITLDELKEEFRNQHLLGLFTGMTALPFIYREENDNFPEIEEILENFEKGDRSKARDCQSSTYVNALKELVDSFHNNR